MPRRSKKGLPEIHVTEENDNQETENEETQQHSLSSNTTSNSGQNKASTPTQGQKAVSFFEPDISHIHGCQPSTSSDNKSESLKSITKATSLPSLNNVKKHEISKNKSTTVTHKKNQKFDAEREMEALKARYIQTFALCHLQEEQNKKETSKLKEMLDQIQTKIAEEKHILEETKQRIQEVKINCELEKTLKSQTAVYEQVLDKLAISNCGASLKETSKLLECYQDKIPVKDIEVPEHGLEQLESSMKKVIESVNNLSHAHNFEMYHQLGNANIALKDCEEVARRCKEKLAEIEKLKLQEASLKIFDGDE